MEAYTTEEQQVQAIKDWWKKNGSSVILGTVIGLAGVFGWRYYGDYEIQQKESSSNAYQNVVTAAASDPETNLVGMQDFVASETASINYRVMAAINLAKSFVNQEQYKSALEQLLWAEEQAPAELKPLIQVRSARLQMQLEQYSEALATLAKISDETYTGQVAQVQGDIYLAQGEVEQARQYYQTALEAAGAQADPSLSLKINDLSVEEDHG